NLRYTARGRPQSWQRFSRRVLNFGTLFALAIFDLLATELGPWFLFHPSRRFNGDLSTYACVSSRRNGTPKSRSKSRVSPSELAFVQIVMFMPCTRVYLSGLSSGNTSCSLSPKL